MQTAAGGHTLFHQGYSNNNTNKSNIFGGTITNTNASGVPIYYESQAGSSYSCTGGVYVGNSSTTYSTSAITVTGTKLVAKFNGPCPSLNLNNGTMKTTTANSSPVSSGSISTSRSGYTVNRTGSSTTTWTFTLTPSSSKNSTGNSTMSTGSKALLNASDINYDNSQTGIECTEAQCALDKIKEMIGDDSNEEK